MSLDLTAALGALFLVLTILFGWRGARPSRPLAAPRLVPWRFLMLLAFAIAIGLGVHLVSLVRGDDGQPPVSALITR
ncbi:MAG: hypothetical protein JOZ27_06000 [Caulobacteraceae bacterium]|nr:hypothetical protein [Caulobacteraceae bacterium]